MSMQIRIFFSGDLLKLSREQRRTIVRNILTSDCECIYTTEKDMQQIDKWMSLILEGGNTRGVH